MSKATNQDEVNAGKYLIYIKNGICEVCSFPFDGCKCFDKKLNDDETFTLVPANIVYVGTSNQMGKLPFKLTNLCGFGVQYPPTSSNLLQRQS